MTTRPAHNIYAGIAYDSHTAALAAGAIRDVTAAAASAGFTGPVFITAAARSALVAYDGDEQPDEKRAQAHYEKRTRAVLRYVAMFAARTGGPIAAWQPGRLLTIPFRVGRRLRPGDVPTTVTLFAQLYVYASPDGGVAVSLAMAGEGETDV